MSTAVWAIFFHKLSTNDKPQHGLQASDDDGVYSRGMPAQWLRMNLNILYHLLLWTQIIVQGLG
jgi:hypothetical protein